MGALRRFTGVPASEGIGIGDLRVLGRRSLPEAVNCTFKGVEAEESRIREALGKVLGSMEEVASASPSIMELVEARKLMAQSMADEAVSIVKSQGACAEDAIIRVYSKYSALLREAGSGLFQAREEDLRELALDFLSSMGLGGELGPVEPGAVLVAESVTPVELIRLAGKGVEALVTSEGGVTSHTAIIARSRGIPYVIVWGMERGWLEGLEGSKTVVDALSGVVIVGPEPEELERYRRLRGELERLRAELSAVRHGEAHSRDGLRIRVECNIGGVEEARIAPESGCEGVGLFRVEFAYMAGKAPPSPDSIYEMLRKALLFMGGRPLTVRAPDIGGDKPLAYVGLREGNPYLGVRGIRLLLRERGSLMEPFIEASLRASAHGDLGLMMPMVSLYEEVKEFVDVVEEVSRRLDSRGVRRGSPRLGIMVETPSSAIMAREIVGGLPISFISVGTNDLAQYVLAADRGNPGVSRIYDDMHPSVLRLLEALSRGLEGSGVDLSVCGELAGRVEGIPVLASMGYRKLSVNPPIVARTKYVASRIDVGLFRDRYLGRVLSSRTSAEVRSVVREYLDALGIGSLA